MTAVEEYMDTVITDVVVRIIEVKAMLTGTQSIDFFQTFSRFNLHVMSVL